MLLKWTEGRERAVVLHSEGLGGFSDDSAFSDEDDQLRAAMVAAASQTERQTNLVGDYIFRMQVRSITAAPAERVLDAYSTEADKR